MAELIIINATKANGSTNAYIGTVGDDGFVYFNDAMFYRFKPEGAWEQNLYVLNRTRWSWSKSTIFKKLSATNLNSGSGSVAPGGQGVEAAVQWAIGIAEDDSHGYDQAHRDGPNYDCSSLVCHAFHNAGFDITVGAGITPSTRTMRSVFTAIGFKWLAGQGNTASQCQRGDILLNEGKHTEIYLGQNMNVGAHINEFGGITGGQTGDQTGREISVAGYYSFPWDGILRFG